MNTKKRKDQLSAAQSSYRTNKKEMGNERLQYWVQSEFKLKLENLAKILGKTKQESIEYAIDAAYKEELRNR